MKKKLPVYYQIEENECGFASLAMILAYHGCPLTLSELRSRILVNQRGLSVGDLINIFSQNKIIATPLLLRAEDITSLIFPAILHWDADHFVVIKNCNKHRVIIHDPKYGVCRITWEEFKGKFCGLALECIPSDSFMPAVKKSDIFKYYKMYFKQRKLTWLLLLLLYIANQFLLFSGLFYFLKLFSFPESNNVSLLLAIVVSFAFIINIFQYLLSMIKAVLQSDYAYRCCGKYVASLSDLSVPKLHSLSLSMVNREFSNTNNHLNNYLSVIIDLAWYLSTSISCLIVLFLYNFYIGLTIFFTSILLLFIYRYYFKNFEISNSEKLSTDSQLSTLLSDLYFGLKSVVLFDRREFFLKTSASLNFKLSALLLKLNQNRKLFQFVNEFLYLAEFVLILVIIYIGHATKSYLIGEFYVLFIYRQIYNRSFTMVLDKCAQYSELFKFYPYLSSGRVSSPVVQCVEKLPFQLFPSSFELKVVNLSHCSEVDGACLFENLSLTIQQEQFAVITGSSGCGKSTFMQVLLGLLPASKGEVIVGDRPLMHYKQHISVVLQHDRFFYGSIIENLTLFKSSEVNDRVAGLCQSMGLYDVIMGLPRQFDTYISNDHMAGLSGGQLQRLFIIRALYANPKILFLDEATSQLDSATEALVIRAIKSQNITCIAISHRPESIAQADRVIDFDELRESAG